MRHLYSAECGVVSRLPKRVIVLEGELARAFDRINPAERERVRTALFASVDWDDEP